MLPMKKNSSGDLFFQDLLISTGHSNSSNQEWLLVIRPERLFTIVDSSVDADQNIIFSGVIKEFVYRVKLLLP